MKPDVRFLSQPIEFWANVRKVSELTGYTQRGTGQILQPSAGQILRALERAGLPSGHLVRPASSGFEFTEFGATLDSYFKYRAATLNTFVEPRLMDARAAASAFTKLRRALKSECPTPMNKQSGAKKKPAYLTAMINMIVHANAQGQACDLDPRQLTTFTRSGVPIRTMARRIDGAFPSAIDPIAVWEIKEYYHTTTFGSRVADGVYETLLDGMELAELREHEGRRVKHYLMVDSHYTWWECGRSYLCRILDTLHMGYIDEVLFGREVLERLPSLVREWLRDASASG